MMKTITDEQRNRVKEILNPISFTCSCDGTGVHIDDFVAYDKLAELVDYLRSVNKPKKSLLDMSIVAPKMLEVVETWLAYKKEKGQSYKPTGFSSFYKKLCKLSNNNPQVAMAIVEESMSNNYAGIFPLKNNNDNQHGRFKTNSDAFDESVKESNKFSQKLHSRFGG
jgi:hypothetical protein